MAPYSNPLMPKLDQLEKMNQDLTRMMPKEMASAVNLLAHPVAGAAAMSALGFGLANHAFGVWLGAWSGAVVSACDRKGEVVGFLRHSGDVRRQR